MICCSKCGSPENEVQIELHHLVPKSLGGTDKDGRKYLCKKCHDILHKMIIKVLWNYVNEKDKAKDNVKSFSLWWIGRKYQK